jgi:hypothetical protein
MDINEVGSYVFGSRVLVVNEAVSSAVRRNIRSQQWYPYKRIPETTL